MCPSDSLHCIVLCGTDCFSIVSGCYWVYVLCPTGLLVCIYVWFSPIPLYSNKVIIVIIYFPRYRLIIIVRSIGPYVIRAGNPFCPPKFCEGFPYYVILFTSTFVCMAWLLLILPPLQRSGPGIALEHWFLPPPASFNFLTIFVQTSPRIT